MTMELVQCPALFCSHSDRVALSRADRLQLDTSGHVDGSMHHEWVRACSNDRITAEAVDKGPQPSTEL